LLPLQHFGKQLQCRQETFKTDGQWLRDHVTQFARWQHPAMKRRTSSDVLGATVKRRSNKRLG